MLRNEKKCTPEDQLCNHMCCLVLVCGGFFSCFVYKLCKTYICIHGWMDGWLDKCIPVSACAYEWIDLKAFIEEKVETLLCV